MAFRSEEEIAELYLRRSPPVDLKEGEGGGNAPFPFSLFFYWNELERISLP